MLSKILNFIFFITTLMPNHLMCTPEKRENMKEEIAVFAMGCFWCAESEFKDHETLEPLPGIISIRVGYAGGTGPNPTYENHLGYKESVKITYDPTKITYSKLLDIFWHNIDPFNQKGQFCDEGEPYKSGIFYTTENQKDEAIKMKENIQKTLNTHPFFTEVIAHTTFYDAEEYHQNYKAKNPLRYKYYRWNCGRDQRLQEIWQKNAKS